ncbi:hypothetical protein C1H71_17195 [Iodobacter fluviatilis]|jgi:transposase InsO family protein|uniref:Integrase catalytic domain-containing protein n=1 Tax=Iodobacter fluviatilis TaxID=537 RepID=A0A7G3GCQ6_9NEIS|nr:hypothetical protein C1H71_17195 [Iodobacter fluviatilis]
MAIHHRQNSIKPNKITSLHATGAQTNGMVERFNRRISEVVQQTRVASTAELEATLLNDLKIYNHHLPQEALGHTTPTQAIKEWQKTKPELFN